MHVHVRCTSRAHVHPSHVHSHPSPVHTCIPLTRTCTPLPGMQVLYGVAFGAPIDIWSLGVTLAELSCGRALFVGLAWLLRARIIVVLRIGTHALERDAEEGLGHIEARLRYGV